MVVRRGNAWWSKGKKGKKGASEGNDGLQKGEERIKKDKANKEPFLNPDCQPQKHPMKKDMAMPGNQTIGLPVTGLKIPGLWMHGGSAQKLMLHGWWQLH